MTVEPGAQLQPSLYNLTTLQISVLDKHLTFKGLEQLHPGSGISYPES
jgi:hypothetical protein